MGAGGCMRDKIGQLSIYIIVVVVVLMLAYLLFLSSPSQQAVSSGRTLPPSDNIAPVYEYINACVEQKTSEAVLYLAFRGLRLDKPVFEIEPFDFAVVYNQGNISIPTEQSTAADLSKIIDVLSIQCSDLPKFPGIEVSVSKPSTRVVITSSSVSAAVTMPTRIKSRSKEELRESYTANIPVSISRLIGFEHEVVQLISANPAIVNITGLSRIDARVLATQFEKSTILYSILDEKQKIDNQPILLQFAGEFK